MEFKTNKPEELSIIIWALHAQLCNLTYNGAAAEYIAKVAKLAEEAQLQHKALLHEQIENSR